MWKITDDIKYKKEVKEIIKSMEPRIIEICDKFEMGNVNQASLPAFFLGIQGDIDDGLKKARKNKKEVKKWKKKLMKKQRNILKVVKQ